MIRVVFILFASLFALETYAFGWVDLWSTPDQQAQYLMTKNQFKKAKDTFERSDWAAAAAYRAGDYEKAAELFQSLKTEQGYYNQGNALAHMAKYEEAIKAYDNALKLNPSDQDAIYNRKLVSDLLKKDKEKQQDGEGQKDKQNQDKQNQDKQNQDKQNQDKQNQDKQNQDKQNQDKQNQDKQNQDKQNQDKQNQDKQNQDKQNQDKQNQDKQNQDKQNQDKQNQDKQKEEQLKQEQDKNKKGNKKQEGDVLTQEEQEKQMAKEQWLRLIPDDPGGLMREKFLRDHLRRERGWYQ